MTPIKRSVSYQFKDSWLRMQVRWHGHRLLLWCGYEVDRVDAKGRPKWDGRRCRNNTTHGEKKTPAASINQYLSLMEQRLADIFYIFEMADRIPAPDEVRDRMKTDGGTAPDIWVAFEAFVADGIAAKGWAPNTVKSVRDMSKILKSAVPAIRFESINAGMLNDVVTWMADHRVSPNRLKTGQKGYSNSTVAKHCRSIRWFLAWATSRGYLSRQAWEDWQPQPKTITQPVVFLEWPELMKMEAAELTPGSEEDNARDFFLFCCFSGLRYSDAAALRKDAVHEDRVDVVAIKTGTPLRIELNDHSRAILRKHAADKGPYALPRITNNRLNHLLKEIGERLDIKASVMSAQYYGHDRVERNVPKCERLSSHCARRTFVCNALALGIPAHVVMKWTGHTQLSSMRPYMEIADNLKARSMSLFNLPLASAPDIPDTPDTPV